MSRRAPALCTVALTLAGCPADEVDPGPPAVQLPLPETSEIDFVAAYREAIDVVLAADVRAVWSGHATSLDAARPGCPDLWVGEPDDSEADGLSWADHCTTPGGTAYDGELTWRGEVSRDGEEGGPAGVLESGRRTLVGNGTVASSSDVVFDFVGTAEDAFSSTVAPDFVQWSYASTLIGEARGVAAFDEASPLPGGLRADLHVAYSGGTNFGVEARGELLLHDAAVAGRFGGIAADFFLPGPESGVDGECVDEPTGWLSIRDADAYWYDLVFQPRYTDDGISAPYENTPYGHCEGCGTLYIRGLEQGTVCIDLSGLFDGTMTPPTLQEYVLPVRGAPEAR